jgi:hypothetical protein
MSYHNYILRLTNNRIKVGFTSNPDKRLNYYRQHWNPQNEWVLNWRVDPVGFDRKVHALIVERLFIAKISRYSIQGTREWAFIGNDGRTDKLVAALSESLLAVCHRYRSVIADARLRAFAARGCA